MPCCCTLLPLLPLPPAPFPLLASRRAGTLNFIPEFRTMYPQDRARKKGAKVLNRTARSPKVHRTCQFMMRQSFS